MEASTFAGCPAETVGQAGWTRSAQQRHAGRACVVRRRWASGALLMAAMLLFCAPDGARALRPKRDSEGGKGDEDGEGFRPQMGLKNQGGRGGRGGSEGADEGKKMKMGRGNGGAGGGVGAGTAMEEATGGLDVSVEQVGRVAGGLAQAGDPLRAVVGLGLLLHSRGLAHLILFTNAFRVSSLPAMHDARVAFAQALAALAAHLPRASFRRTLLPALFPEVGAAVNGLHYGVVTFIASVVSPLIGALALGGSIGKSLEDYTLPLVARLLRLRTGGPAFLQSPMAAAAASHAPETLGMLFALAASSPATLLSGSLLGAHLLCEVSARRLRLILESRPALPPLLRKVHTALLPSHPTLSLVTLGVALLAFLSQASAAHAPVSPSLPLRALLAVPLLLDAAAAKLKWALLARRAPGPPQ